MKLDIIKAAKLLGMSQEMLQRWAHQGKISAEKQSGVFWFSREDLEVWAHKRNVPVYSDSPKDPDDEAVPVEGSLFHAMTRGGVFFDVPGKNAQEVLQSAMANMELPVEMDRDVLLDELLQREKLASTGIGNGVAIPHPRHPMEHSPPGGMIATCFPEKEISFDSLDDKPVFVLFIILSPNTKLHLNMLSRLSFCLRENDFVFFLKSCRNAASFLARVLKIEKGLAYEQEKGV